MNEKEYYLKQAKRILLEVKKTVVGKDEMICKIMMAILAKGHVLIEDIPGVGKTTMALAFARTLGLACNRMQFTPDVMPSDIIGFNMYNRATNKFEFKPGAVLCNLFLGDEINRTSPKTQSALLQVMEEGVVTVDGATMQLPNPFIVLATQNPFGSVGTQRLPESQLDRFMIRLTLGYPTVADEIAILKGKQREEDRVKSQNVIDVEDFLVMRSVVDSIYVDDDVYDYVARIAKASRSSSDILQGISPRGSIAMIAMAKAAAFLRGHSYVLPADVQYVAADVMGHRLVLNRSISRGAVSEAAVVKNLMDSVRLPQIAGVHSEKVFYE